MAVLALETGKTEISLLDVDATILTNPAGATLTAMDAVTLDATTGKHVLADANVAALDRPVGVVLQDAISGLASAAVYRGLVSGLDLTNLDYGDPVYLSSTPGKLIAEQAAVNEVQTLTESGSPSGGTFTLGFDGETTAAIAYNATGAQVATALGLLANIGVNGVSGSGSASGPFVITFASHLAGAAVPLITLATNSMTGGSSPTITIVETTAGATLRCVGHVFAKHDVPKGSSPDKILGIGM